MRRVAFVWLTLLTVPPFAAAADFRLGLNYTEWGPTIDQVRQKANIASDSSGALYILSFCTSDFFSPSCLTKLAADGKTILWQNTLAFRVQVWAVDPNGGIYVIPAGPPSTSPVVFPFVIEKLSAADGTTVLWKTLLSDGGIGYVASLAVDASGRAFIAGSACRPECVVRLNTSGAIDATFPNLPTQPISIAVDPSGSDVVIGSYPNSVFGPAPNAPYILVRLAPDQATWLTVTPQRQITHAGLAVAPNGDAVLYGSDASGNRSLQRIDRTGGSVFSNTVLSQTSPVWTVPAAGALVLDAAGNAYITGYTGPFGIPTRNSVAPCGTTWMNVYAPDGTILQTTYLPGATSTPPANPVIALGSDSGLFVAATADPTLRPTQDGPFPQLAGGVLLNFSPNASAQTLPLACVASAYTFSNGAVAPGEMVALYGNSLGPLQGIVAGATPLSPFPTEAGGVEVTFDGVPAPLMWAQDSQINAAVPWSVAGPTTQVCVTYNQVRTNCLTWPVAPAAPGVLTVDGTFAVAVNQDGTLNSASNPASPNSIVAIFATGLGPISSSPADGALVTGSPLPVNTFPVTLEVLMAIGFNLAAFPVPTTYAGPAPFQIAGTSQINFNVSYVGLGTPAAGGPTLLLRVQTPSGAVSSNSFRIYVAATAAQPVVRRAPHEAH